MKITNEIMEQFRKEFEEEREGMTIKNFAERFNKKHGYDFDESSYRKRLHPAYNGMEDLSTAYLDEREHRVALREINAELREKRLNKKQSLISKEADKLINGQKLSELFEQMVTPTTFDMDDKVEYRNLGRTNIFVLSDIQCDGNGWTEQVLDDVYYSIIARIHTENIKEIVLLLNGDEIDNLLRSSSMIDNKTFPYQLNEINNALAKLLVRLTKHVYVKFSMVNSNHNELRMFGFRAGETKQMDITIIILNFLKAYLRYNQNIEWLNGDATSPTDLNYNIIDVQGYKIFQQHGDMKGIKLNNSKQTFSNVRDFVDEDIDYCLFGHYHHYQAKSINMNRRKGGNKMVIWVPALDPRLKKENEVSLMVSSAPGFLRLVVEEGHGITLTELIPLSKEVYR